MWHQLLFALIVYTIIFLVIGIFGTIACTLVPMLTTSTELLVGALPALAALLSCAIGFIVNCNAVGAMDVT